MKLIQKILMSDTTALRWQMSWLGMFFMAGFLFLDTSIGIYKAMLSYANPPFWVLAFGLYSAGRMYTCAYVDKRVTNILVSIVGFSLWTFTSLSFSHDQQRLFGPADLLIVMPLLCEVWIGADLWSLNKK